MSSTPYPATHWDRGDGYDARDPNAPDVPVCGGCDGLMFDGVCVPCNEPVRFTRAVRHGEQGWAIVDAELAA